MEKPYRIGFMPLVEIPKKEKFNWRKYSNTFFTLVITTVVVVVCVGVWRAKQLDVASDKVLDSQCKTMGAIDMVSCRNCLILSSIPNDPRCGSVNRWNVK